MYVLFLFQVYRISVTDIYYKNFIKELVKGPLKWHVLLLSNCNTGKLVISVERKQGLALFFLATGPALD